MENLERIKTLKERAAYIQVERYDKRKDDLRVIFRNCRKCGKERPQEDWFPLRSGMGCSWCDECTNACVKTWHKLEPSQQKLFLCKEEDQELISNHVFADALDKWSTLTTHFTDVLISFHPSVTKLIEEYYHSPPMSYWECIVIPDYN